MNADVRSPQTEIEARRWTLPGATWWRLRQRLGHALGTGECLTASLSYGAPPDLVSALVEYCCNDFELERQPLFGLPLFATRAADAELCFVHARSNELAAVPLLLLHGYCGLPAEFQDSITRLTDSSPQAPAFHVICPALPGFGISGGIAGAHELALTCAELMARLGYSRYLVHGSDLGANIALELTAVDGQHVAGAHVTALPAFPSESVDELGSLTSVEKSQLARLTEMYDELCFNLPESPAEQLAFALSRCDDVAVFEPGRRTADALLTGLALAWTMGSANTRARLYRDSRLTSAPPSRTPLAVHAYPLDAPILRRFAEREHRVVDWIEHEVGGCCPALEAPELFRSSLRGFFDRFL